MNSFNRLPIGVAILSWKSPETVRNTLQTYTKNDFLSLFEDVVLCFQAISDADQALAKDLGIRYVGNEKNTGIQGGFRMAYENLNCEYVMVLENDCLLRTDRGMAYDRLSEALSLLQDGRADLVRMRSRYHPGPPMRAASVYSRFYPIVEQAKNWTGSEELSTAPDFIKKLRRTIRPFKARKWIGRSVYIEEHPELKHPRYINKIKDTFIVDSAVLPWTNQPTLLSRKLFQHLLDFADAHPSSRTVNGLQDFEKNLNCAYWRKRHYKIGVSTGIFTHLRLDR